MTLMVAVEGAQSILVMTNAAESTPTPLRSAVMTVIVVIPAIQVPVSPNSDPPAAIPALQDPEAIQIPSHTLCTTPEPASWLVVVIALPQMPVGPNASPVSLVIAVQRAATIQMHTNAAVAAPTPLSSAVQTMIVVILPPQTPVTSNNMPTPTVPPLQDPEAIQMPTDTPGSSPEPSTRTVEMILLPQMPVRSHLSPLVQSAPPVEVVPDAAITTP